MRLLRAATILALLLSPLYAGYVVKWTLPLPWNEDAYLGGKPDISDVDGDSIPDLFVSDSTSLRIYSGVSHILIWTVPSMWPPVLGSSPPVVANTDDDLSNELVLISPYTGSAPFFIYDCVTHALEFTSPAGENHFPGSAVADLDGDGRAEILFTSGNYETLLVLAGPAAA